MIYLSGMFRSRRRYAAWLLLLFSFGLPARVTEADESFLFNVGQLVKQLGDTSATFGTLFPTASNGAFHEMQGVRMKKRGSCTYLLEWDVGVRCSDLKAFVDPEKRMVTVELQHSEKEVKNNFSSMSASFFEQSMSLDRDCLVNKSVVEHRLAGYIRKDSPDKTTRGHSVLILFPSKERAQMMEKDSAVPKGTVEALEAGDAGVISKLTDHQACLLMEGRDCEDLKRNSRAESIGAENSEAIHQQPNVVAPSLRGQRVVEEQEAKGLALPNLGTLNES